MRGGEEVQQSGREPAHQIEEEKAEPSHPVLDVVAEDPQEPHVRDEVKPAPVQEGAGDEREIAVVRKANVGGPGRIAVTARNQPAQHDQELQPVFRESDLVKEHHHVDRDERPGDDRRATGRDIVSQGDHAAAGNLAGGRWCRSRVSEA
jgi:hypothetical protein